MSNKTINTLAGICLGMISVLVTPLVYADGALPEPGNQWVARTPAIVGSATASPDGGVSSFEFNGHCKGELISIPGQVLVAFNDLDEESLQDVYFAFVEPEDSLESGNCDLGGAACIADGVIITSVGHVAEIDSQTKMARGVIAKFVYTEGDCEVANADYLVPAEEPF